MNRTPLSLFWWVRSREPHAYVCPLLITLSALIWRLRGKPARWIAARWGEYWDGGELVTGWISPARVVIGHCEASCLFPRWLVLAECDFWNSRLGLCLRGWVPEGEG